MKKHILPLISSILLFNASFSQSSALEDYVALEDTSFNFYAVDTLFGTNYTNYILYMSSQSWRNLNEVDRTLWEHWVSIVIPSEVYYDKALLFINGGSNSPDPPGGTFEESSTIAALSHTIVVNFGMVPNEPLTFTDETESRSEDAIIAYSWDKYLNGGDETWILQLPMVKSVVRGMDMAQTFVAGLDSSYQINQFVLSGASKRGWTTWLTSAVDDRVCGMIPIVFDALNTIQSFKHHYGAYGFWSPAVWDYENMGIFDWFSYPEIYYLMSIVDPLKYKDRFATMPKYLIHATGDEFFVPSSQFYFDQLPGPTFQRYVPNASHSLEQALDDVVYSFAAFYKAILNDFTLPEFSWEMMEDGSIRFETVTSPTQVKLWQAYNPNAYDFRYMTIGPAWNDVILSDQGNGVYLADITAPDSGWTAFYIEAIYSSGGQFPYKFSTDVSFLPKTLPHAADITFTVTDPQNTVEEIWIKGDLTSGVPYKAYDDGNHEDENAADGIWAVTIPLVIDGDYSFNVIGQMDGDSMRLNPYPILFTVEDGIAIGETSFTINQVNVIERGVPKYFIVHPAYPNPFNPRTTISYEIPVKSQMSISILNILGKNIYQENFIQYPGHHQFIWYGQDGSGKQMSAGIYLLKISNGHSIDVTKLVMIK